ncbi:MAG TPA: ABC transporter ATP-binding protein [Lentisphaeria bacterium]|nr:ABC transporter ATP-binding protein [Lentisphaeria bacterium]HCG49790.1 ABC transporter ATP-binding protein [Lentisphaeria bacterium]
MKIITVEHLSKYYTIGHDRNSGVIRYKTFRESMMSAGRSLYQRLRHPLSPNREQVELEEFRALDDVSFEVEQGDRIGIIGRNGAGKSTLLKLLCRITEPTKGRITMRGRVASLLEVGTGFHPELSGRENIYLNGAILGMKRAEIKRKFDEIVAFSGVEKFLDTPVKRYSSGMYVRLAFAVAAHLESEILLIDEVLAVGDAEFQKKCLGKMDDISKNEGRTILFVSHNMGAIKNLCNKGILLCDGRNSSKNNIEDIISEYMIITPLNYHDLTLIPRKCRVSGAIKFECMKILNANGIEIIPSSGDEVHIVLQYSSNCFQSASVSFAISFSSYNGTLFYFNTDTTEEKTLHVKKCGIITCIIPKFPLTAGIYYINVYAAVDGCVADWITDIPFEAQTGDFFGTGNLKIEEIGKFYPLIPHFWQIDNTNNHGDLYDQCN